MTKFITRYRKNEQVILGTTGLIFVIFLWQVVSSFGWINPFFISRPTEIFLAVIEQTTSSRLLSDFKITIIEFFVAFGSAVVIGVSIGLLMGWFKRMEYITDPFIWFLYSTPIIAIYPLLIIWLGLGFKTVVTLGFLFSITPIIINTYTGVKETKPILIRAAHSFGANKRQILMKIALPSAIPMIVTGWRIGVERALVGVIVGEMFSSNSGLGFLISFYGAKLQIANLFVSIVLVIILGLFLTQSLRILEKKLLKWQE
ncbi:ABC transporter permease [Neobacillus niacini]|uniref:ABC transporter permease n=1 Tax=Neobacillus niacini TaxID=86668 RepID=UPI002FFE501B